LGLGFLLVVLPDVLVDVLRELQVLVDVARIGIVSVGADRKLLL
jgi:hypothetical protein